MTKILIIESNQSKIDFSKVRQGIIHSFEGACDLWGKFKHGWQPPGQWYVRHEGMGNYYVVHNQNRLDYGVSCSITNGESGVIKVTKLEAVQFNVSITRDNQPINLPFRFTMTFRIK